MSEKKHKRKFNTFGPPDFYERSKRRKQCNRIENMINPYFHKIAQFLPKSIALITYDYTKFTDEDLRASDAVTYQTLLSNCEYKVYRLRVIEGKICVNGIKANRYYPVEDFQKWERQEINKVLTSLDFSRYKFLSFFDIDLSSCMSIRHYNGETYKIYVHSDVSSKMDCAYDIIRITNVSIDDIMRCACF